MQGWSFDTKQIKSTLSVKCCKMFYLSCIIFSLCRIIHPFENVLFTKVGPDVIIEDRLVPYPLEKGSRDDLANCMRKDKTTLLRLLSPVPGGD